MAQPRILLCADDFAISRGTSQVIAELVRTRCINAVSCMTAAPGWMRDAELLLGAVVENPDVEIGLHLTLSGEQPLGRLSCQDAAGRLPGPDRLLARCLTGGINADEFSREIERQFDAFCVRVGRPPDFVDAHQHVHVYPVLRHLVVGAVATYSPDAWVRVPSDRLTRMLSRPFAGKAVGSALHCTGFRGLLKRYGLRSNSSFAGHYDFGSGYSDLLDRFLVGASDFHVVMCHPGAKDVAHDTIGDARVTEAAVLAEHPLWMRLKADRTRNVA